MLHQLRCMPWEARDKSATSVRDVILTHKSHKHSLTRAVCTSPMTNHCHGQPLPPRRFHHKGCSCLVGFLLQQMQKKDQQTRQSVAIGYHSFKSEELLLTEESITFEKATQIHVYRRYFHPLLNTTDSLHNISLNGTRQVSARDSS